MAESDTERKAGKSDEDLLTEIRENYQKDSDADARNRQLALADMRFVNVPGSQWDDLVLAQRGPDRPHYEFNKLRITIKRVVNDMRANRPSGKVRATNDDDTDQAEIREGLIRNILSNSDFDTVIDQAAEYQVTGGMGAWRVNTVLPEDEVVNQDITLEAIHNPFSLYADRHCQDVLKRDANHWTVTDMVGFDTFNATYGKKVNKDSFSSSGFDNMETWLTPDSVRVCEYWYKEPTTKTLLLLQDGRTIDQGKLKPDELKAVTPNVVKSREVKAHDIYSCIASGTEVLSKPTKWAGSKFPFIIVYGDYVVIDGRIYWYGMTRWSKDAQVSYNFTRTTIIEKVARAPEAKYWMTPAMALGLQDSYAEAHKRNLPVAFYNPDPKSPGPPQRMGEADMPAALIQLTNLASEDIKATSGIFDNSLGQTANETSGVAIRARQNQGEIATFNYMDNLTKGVCLTWEIVGDLIGAIYDGARTVRILGQDGAEKFHKLNETVLGPDGQPLILNDMSAGKYDYTVTSGPSYSTQRQEASEVYTQMVQANPQLFPLIGDLIMKATDLPYADEIATRLKTMLPPQLQEQPDGKPLPPQAIQAMQQASQAMAHVQQMTQMIQQAQSEVDQGKQEMTAEQNKLAIQKAELDATFEKYMANIVKAQSALAVSEAQAQIVEQGQHHEDLAQQVNEGLQQVQQMAGAYMQQVQQALGNIADTGLDVTHQVIQHPPAPTSKSVRVKRINGELHGEVVDNASGAKRHIAVKRVNGELQGQINDVPQVPPQGPPQ